ncbi:unnamed protein product [Symbiodinium sp. KB8]|nr:unnamed protein product [Symbiodinium sp. KB8]
MLTAFHEEYMMWWEGAFAAGGTGRLMKVDVDYVDQAKFKVPRNLDLTKSTEGLWRPQLHTGGILIWGVAEVYIIAEADLPKGSAAEDYVDVIRETVKPTRGRELVVDVLTGVWDFKMYYQGLDVTIAGLAFMKFISLASTNKDLPSFDKKSEVEWQVTELQRKDYQPTPDDAVLLTKEWISSPALSQPPLLILPKDRLNRLPPALQPVMRHKLFTKTANFVLKEPWCLDIASKYLKEWMACNQQGTIVEFPMPQWFFNNSTESQVNLSVPEPVGWEKYAPGPVRMVTAADTTNAAPAKKKARKQPPEVPAPQVPAVAVVGVIPREAEVPLPGDVPAEEAAAPSVPGQIRIPDLSELGCPKCRGAPGGCAQCWNEDYRRARIARLQAQAAKAAAQAAKAAAQPRQQGEAKAKAGGRGRGRGRGRTVVA